MIDTDKSPNSFVEQAAEESPAVPEMFNFQIMRPRFDQLEKDWHSEKLESERRRRIRKIEVNMETLRASGKLKADEVLIGVRVIDENIKKEQPVFVNYMTESRRLAIFDCISNPSIKADELETKFTKGMSYDGFIRNMIKCIDGAETHGWDSVECTFDPKKPLHSGVEHIGHENLLFPKDAKDLQACEFILRRFQLTPMKLKSFVKKHNFNGQQVDMLLESTRAKTNEVPHNVEVFKVFFKVEGIVYVAWACLHGNTCSDWIMAPSPLSLGRRTQQQRTVTKQQTVITTGPGGEPVPNMVTVPVVEAFWQEEQEEDYPIKIYLYSESEEQCLTEQKGRVFYDLPWQEAQQAIWSMGINGSVRASNVYCSPVNRSNDGSPPKKLDLTLEHGCVYSEPLTFFHTDYPDPALFRVGDAMDTRKAAEMGQVASSVINRDDSRKTAKEIGTAKEQEAKINSVSLLFFSTFLRGVLAFNWYIVQSQAQQNLVIVAPDANNPLQNDPEIINQVYDVKPAGDIDVVRRQERITTRLGILPIIQAFGGELYFEFVRDVLRDVLPEDAKKYITLMGQDQMKNQAIQALMSMLQSVMTDEKGQLKPEFKQYEPQLQQAMQMLPQITGAQGGQ